MNKKMLSLFHNKTNATYKHTKAPFSPVGSAKLSRLFNTALVILWGSRCWCASLAGTPVAPAQEEQHSGAHCIDSACTHWISWAPLAGQTVESLPAVRKARVWSLGWEDSL